MNFRDNKGVTLIALVITIVVLLIITGIITYNSTSHLGLKEVNKLYVDIDSLSTKISDYYLSNNNLPIIEKKIYGNDDLKKVNENLDIFNSNDNEVYYVIDLSELDNLTLNFGRDYFKYRDNTEQLLKDIYVINDKTHQIYYLKGIVYKNRQYYTKLYNINNNSIKLDFTSDNNKYNILIDGNNIANYNSNFERNTSITNEITVENYENLKKIECSYQEQSNDDTDNNIDNSLFTIFDIADFDINENEMDFTFTFTSRVLTEDKYYICIRLIDSNGLISEYKSGEITVKE